jgi:peptidyl-prolyl cis-trans isomerase SurA
MSKIFKLVLLFGIIGILPAVVQAAVIDGIAAIVNDDVISSYDVDKGMALLVKEAEKRGQTPPLDKSQLRTAALNQLIEKKLIDQKIKELDIKVSEDELRQTIEDVKKQNNNMTQENLVAALKAQGVSFEQYKTELREQLERMKLMGQEVRAKIQVGEKEIRDYYDANRKKFGEDELFRARHIFFRVNKDASAEETKRIMTAAQQVLEEAKSGKDFAELARKYSDDPQAAKDAGDLGTFKKGDMLPAIEETVDKMKPGEISGLVSTPAGYHIIKLEERYFGNAKPFDTVKGEIEELLYKKKSEERFEQWLAELRKGAAIEIKQ